MSLKKKIDDVFTVDFDAVVENIRNPKKEITPIPVDEEVAPTATEKPTE